MTHAVCFSKYMGLSMYVLLLYLIFTGQKSDIFKQTYKHTQRTFEQNKNNHKQKESSVSHNRDYQMGELRCLIIGLL